MSGVPLGYSDNLGAMPSSVVTEVHIWYNFQTDFKELKLSLEPNTLITHIRTQPLNKKYLSKIVHFITKSTSKLVIHILVLSNSDVQICRPNLLPELLELLFKIAECRPKMKFICLDLITGSNRIINFIKHKLLQKAFTNHALHSFYEFGRSFGPRDLHSLGRFSLSGKEKLKDKLLEIISYQT